MTADIIGIEIARMQTIESTSLGAAIATFTAVGEFKDVHEACASMTNISHVFKPNMENHKAYNRIYKEVYLKIYPSLNPINRTINKIFKR